MSAPILRHGESVQNSRGFVIVAEGYATAAGISKTIRRPVMVMRDQTTMAPCEWLGPRSPMFRVVRPAPATRWQRFAEACWRVHDGAVWLWAIAGVLVLLASLAAVAGLINPQWIAWIA